ncbi:MAG: flippase-like domain-containing protein [Bacteroidales bacterium]|nr:flippase-like domain-containing protein [Bacteroidales bacterium]
MKKVVSYILFLCLAAILLWFSFKEVKWSDFIDGLQTSNYYWIGASMVFGALSFWIRAMRWRLLINGAGYQTGRKGVFDAVNIAYLTNFAIPRAGEVARCGVVAKTDGVPFDTSLGTVLLERAIDVLSLLIITAFVIVLQWDVFGLFIVQQLWNPFSETLGGNTVYIIGILLILTGIFVLMIVYWKRLEKWFVFRKIGHFITGIYSGLKSGLMMRQKVPFVGYTLILWFLYWAMCRCTMLAFPAVAQLNSLDAIFLMAVGSMGWVVPVQGGIGAYHFIVSLALASVYGISQTQGVVFATISHESQALTMIAFGLFSVIRIGMAKKTFRKQALPNR